MLNFGDENFYKFKTSRRPGGLVCDDLKILQVRQSHRPGGLVPNVVLKFLQVQHSRGSGGLVYGGHEKFYKSNDLVDRAVSSWVPDL